MKYYIIAGEASGDLHGSNLVRELKNHDSEAVIRGWGGDLMAEQGVEIVKHYKELAFMGFVEVLMNIFTIFRNIAFCKNELLDFRPDVLILIDYPGFNLRIAAFARKNGIKVFYYISPQIWAWKQSRINLISAFVDKMFVILPFEKDFYAKFNYSVDFAGHPLMDAIDRKAGTFSSKESFFNDNGLDERPVVAIIPGSRKQEISHMLPEMLKVYDNFPDYQFVIAGAGSIDPDFYAKFTGNNFRVVYNKTYELLHYSDAALVCSGTATLETALMNVPEVVCYKSGYVSYFIARQLIKVRFISLVNLIVDKEIVKELIQKSLNSKQISFELDKLLRDQKHRSSLLTEYGLLREKLGGSGASSRIAGLMYNYLKND